MKVKKIKKELKNMVELKKFLKNPSPKVKVPLYTEIEVDQNPNNFGDGTVKKPTLSQRIDELTVLVKDGFTELRQDVKDIKIRLDKVETRLDYIVKSNNLKDRK